MVSSYRCSLYKKSITKIPIDHSNQGDFYYIVSSENKLIDKFEVESARIVISRELRKLKKKNKKFWVYVNYDFPFHKKSSHSRMGKGKGAIDSYKKFITINSIVFRLESSTFNIIMNIFKIIQSKLSFSIAVYKDGKLIIGDRL